ncbi:MAG: hypothetical protein ACE5H2_00390 [Terriglobia bacterium]
MARAAGKKVFEKTVGSRLAGALAERGISLPRLVEETIRSGAVGAKFGAVVPRREVAGQPTERLREAGTLAGISALFPGGVAALRMSGVPEAIANAWTRLTTRMKGVEPGDELLAATARRELQAILRAKPIKDALQQEGSQLGESVRAVINELDDIGRITLEQAPAIAETGTVAATAKVPLRQLGREVETDILERQLRGIAGERARQLAEEQVARRTSLTVSPQRVRTLNKATVILSEQIKEFATNTIGKAENLATVEQAQALVSLMSLASRQRVRFARTFGLTGRAFQEPVSAQARAEARAAVDTLVNLMKRANVSLEGLPALESGPAKTLFREGVEALKSRNLGRAARIFGIDFWRRAIFPWFSFLADLPSDIGTLAEKGQRDIVSDVLDFVRTGQPGKRVQGTFDAIRYWRAFPKEELERVLGTDPALSLRFKPFFGERADIAAFTGLKLKTLVDGTARAFAFKSTILAQAHREAVSRGLHGVARQNFVRRRAAELLKDPNVVTQALKEGQKASFTLPLPASIERLTGHPFTILLLSPFAKFGFNGCAFLLSSHPPRRVSTARLWLAGPPLMMPWRSPCGTWKAQALSTLSTKPSMTRWTLTASSTSLKT